MKTVLARLTGFSLLPLISLVTPLLLLPVIASIVGSAGVASVVSGQAIGTFAATVLMWGWSFEGPVAVAQASGAVERGLIYQRSVRDRIVLAVLVLPVASLIAAWVATPEFWIDAVAMTLAVGLTGLSPAWFCVGLGQPALSGLYDTVPRAAATIVAVPILFLTQAVWPYAVLTTVVTTVSLMLFHRRVVGGQARLPGGWLAAFPSIWRQRHTGAINIGASAYASTPSPIATVTNPGFGASSLATADSLYRFSLAAIIAVANALQSWVLDPAADRPRRRQVAALLAHAALGVVGVITFSALGPWATSVLFAGRAQASVEVSFYYGLAFFFISTGTPLVRNLLLPAGRQATVLRWTLISALCGVGAMLGAGLTGNWPKIGLGMAASEGLLTLGLLVPALGELKKHPLPEPA